MNRDIIELREVVQKLVPLLSGKGLTVTQRGSQAYVSTNPRTKQPETVNIPNIPDSAPPEFVQAIQGFIDHEVGHVLHTDWNFYGGKGGMSVADLQDPKRRAFMNTHNIIEDVMIEREMCKTFPGSARNISSTRKWFLEKITNEALKATKDPKEQFRYLIVPMMRAIGGHEEMQDFMDDGKWWTNIYVQELLTKMKPATIELLKTCTNTEETLVISEEVHAIIMPSAAPEAPVPPKEKEEKKKDERDEKKKKGKSEDKPEKKADEGDGDGERDHEDTKPDEDGDGDAKDDEKDKDEEEDAGADAGDDDGAEKESDEAESGDDDGDTDTDEPSKPEPKNAASDDDEAGEDEAAAAGDDADDDAATSSGASGIGAEPGNAGDGDESDGDAEGGNPPIRTEGADGGGVGTIDGGDDHERQGGGGGVGNESAKSLFDYEDDDFDEVDMSSQIAIKISDEAVLAMDPKQYLVFTREMDQIQPVEVPEKMNKSWVPAMEDETRLMTSKMSKDIERAMASQSHVIRTPGHKTGKLHAPSLFRVTQGDPRVFSQRQEHVSKDTAVSLVVDNSGSMGGPKMKLGMIASYALSSTLDRVKIAHEVIGFTTGGYWNGVPDSIRRAMADDAAKAGINWDRMTPIIMPIYKSFEERITATVKARFAYMMNAQAGLNGNVDGESLQYAAERLLKRPEKRKVMLVLSDGQPAGSHKSGPHLSHVVKDLERFGIECVGIGILDDSVKKFYPKYTVLRTVEDLPGQVMAEIKKILM
jgi:Mg-chelatase subunit ChlD